MKSDRTGENLPFLDINNNMDNNNKLSKFAPLESWGHNYDDRCLNSLEIIGMFPNSDSGTSPEYSQSFRGPPRNSKPVSISTSLLPHPLPNQHFRIRDCYNKIVGAQKRQSWIRWVISLTNQIPAFIHFSQNQVTYYKLAFRTYGLSRRELAVWNIQTGTSNTSTSC